MAEDGALWLTAALGDTVVRVLLQESGAGRLSIGGHVDVVPAV